MMEVEKRCMGRCCVGWVGLIEGWIVGRARDAARIWKGCSEQGRDVLRRATYWAGQTRGRCEMTLRISLDSSRYVVV